MTYFPHSYFAPSYFGARPLPLKDQLIAAAEDLAAKRDARDQTAASAASARKALDQAVDAANAASAALTSSHDAFVVLINSALAAPGSFPENGGSIDPAPLPTAAS